MPIAMKPAFMPTTPPPMIITVAAATPGPPPTLVLDGLIGDAGGPRRTKGAGLLRIGCQMQEGEQQLARAQQLDLRRLQLLDVEDHLRFAEDRLRVGNDTGVLGGEVGVCDRASLAGQG